MFDIYAPYLMLPTELMDGKTEWKDRIGRQWIESRNLPRKKKKAVRKILVLEWQLACWEPTF